MNADPFLGTAALAEGLVPTKHQLRTRFRAVFPDVYLPVTVNEPDLSQRTVAAWLWSGKQGVVSGQAAAALHGAKWVADDTPVDLIHVNPRAPSGIRTRRDGLDDGEITLIAGMAVTTPERTAFDLGRWLRLDEAVTRLDALGNAVRFDPADVLELARAHRGSRNVRRLPVALDLHDPGAASPKETWLRLIPIRAGYPRPATQIPVDCGDGYPRYYLDVGWEELKIALEYDGAHHRDPEQIRYDIVRLETLAALGWIVIRVVAGTSRAEVRSRLRRAWSVRSSVRPDRQIA